MVNFLLGQQFGYTKHPCFLCMWDSRDKANHWVKKDWEPRIKLKAGEENIINEPLKQDNIPPSTYKVGTYQAISEIS